MENILITGHTLTLEELAAVCRENAPVALSLRRSKRHFGVPPGGGHAGG
ncbi:MAG: hypothetical protein ACLU9S_02355 [Oscillospiraceae bacterium]